MSERDKRILQIGVFLGLVLFIGGAYYQMVFAQRDLAREESTRKDLSAKKTDLEGKLREVRELKKQRGRLEEMSKMVEQASRRLPQTANAEGFLNSLLDILNRSSVINQSVVPSGNVSQETYTEIPWKIKGAGQFHEFGVFLNIVEHNPARFMRVKGFSIRNDPKWPGYHPIDVEISTFMFNK